jgi:16S rRNA (cytidine1402-2'-O)-methyltransferase
MGDRATTSSPREENGRALRAFTVSGARVNAEPLAPGLYVVATPIGNLADITLRALSILAAADLVLAEDTRVSHNLFSAYGVATPLSPYHEHNAREARPKALARLAEGAAIALISDAGTPLVSDPGFKLVQAALEAGITVIAAPGASAALAALCVGGLPTDRFFFEGFLPAKSAARRERVNALANVPGTLVIYEAPSRLAESLRDLADELGPRPAAVARELTKFYEEVRRGALDDLAAQYAAEPTPKGEIVILVGPPGERAEIGAQALDQAILAALAELSIKDAAAAIAARHGLKRRTVYARALELAGARR